MILHGNRTEAVRALQRKQSRQRKERGEDFVAPAYDRPTFRADCEYGFRPCPFVGCRYNLFLDVRRSGSITYPHGRQLKDLAEMRQSCALDVANKGPNKLGDIAGLFGVTRERARQMVAEAIMRLAKVLKRVDVAD